MSAYAIFREGQMPAHSFSGRRKCPPLFFREGKCPTPRFRKGQMSGAGWGQMSGGKCPTLVREALSCAARAEPPPAPGTGSLLKMHS